MIEPQREKEPFLRTLVDEDPKAFSYRMLLLGAERRPAVRFFELETGSSVLEEQSDVPRKIVEYPLETLDEVLAGTSFEKVDFLKLDVQGCELDVLRGAARTLRSVEAVLAEVSLLPIDKGAPLIDEVVQYMSGCGFVIFDICSLIRRPRDMTLWQADLLFVRKTSPMRADERFE